MKLRGFGEEKSNRPVLLALAVLLLAAVVLLCTGIYTHRYGKNAPGSEEPEEISGEQAEEPTGPSGGLERVNLLTNGHYPAAREKGMDWDGSFLSDLGTKSEYCFTDKADGQEIACEVYTDTAKSVINKIVTVKAEQDGMLEIVDYYYHNNKPYFISQRHDNIYTPTYETTDRPGIRFYFSDDVLVRCRTVVPGSLLVSQTGLSLQNNPDYEEFDYFTAPDAIREQYDKYEGEWLNRGYNILNAVRNSKSIGRVSGKVSDNKGNVLGGRKIYLQDAETGEPVYDTETNSDGRFSMYVKRDDRNYSLVIPADTRYRGMSVSGLVLDSSTAVYEYNNIALYPADGDKYTVKLSVFDGEAYRDYSAGSSGVFSHVVIREGYNNKTGKEIASSDTDFKGFTELSLEPGCYTVEAACEGYVTRYTNLEVPQYGCDKQIFVVKKPADNTATVLMTWDSDADLDLTVFTPYQAEGGDMAHIGGLQLKDGHGNSVVSDNAGGCEVGYINLSNTGGYRAYVNNYSAVESGAYGAETFAGEKAGITVYYPDGTEKICETGSEDHGILWDAVELSKNSCTVIDRIYCNVNGKSWWLADKDVVKAQENEQFKSGMPLTGRLVSDYSYGYMDKEWVQNKKLSLAFDTPVKICMNEDGVDRVHTYDRIDVSFDLKQDYDALTHLDLLIGQYITGTIKAAEFTEEGEPYLVLQSLSLLHKGEAEDTAVPKEYLAILADRIKEAPVAYTVIYVNDNTTPELVILNPKDNAHTSGADIYTYDNGEVELIGSFGSWGGNFTYYPMRNLIRTEETSTGTHTESYCYFDKHMVYTVDYESSLEFPEYGISRVLGQYTMNGIEYVNPFPGRGSSVPTTAEEYEKQLESMFRSIDRSTGRYIDKDACLRASRIEDIRFK